MDLALFIFLPLFIFIFIFYFIFSFTLLYFILDLDKECDVTSYKSQSITFITGWSHMSHSCNIEKDIEDSEIDNII